MRGVENAPAMPALVTGVGRSAGIGAAVAEALRADGWQDYDRRMPWGADASRLTDIEADLADPATPAALFSHANQIAGTVSALVCCHCESVDSTILDTTVESFDRHFVINCRATWLLIKGFAEQFTSGGGNGGRIVAITSDHTAFLCSADGRWINGQVLCSDGGLKP